MSLLVSIFAIIAVLAGVFFFIAGTLGLLRFGDTLSRIHALTKADNLGLGLIVLGLLPLVDSVADALKLVVIWALVLLGGTTAAQLVASAVRREQDPPS
jgi:multicomponent Na+:H+ antiporter subunit G